MSHNWACIFDMDGLLFDTERLCKSVWQALGEEKHFPVSDELYYACIGHNSADVREILMTAQGPSFPYDEFRNEARERMNATYEKSGPPEKPGIRQLFSHLKAHNIPIALATSSNEATARAMIEKAGLTAWFDAWAFGSEVEHGKPEPDIFLLAAERLDAARPAGQDAQPLDFVVFEDSEAGLLAAYHAGMKSVFIKDILLPSPVVLDTVWANCATLDAAASLFS